MEKGDIANRKDILAPTFQVSFVRLFRPGEVFENRYFNLIAQRERRAQFSRGLTTYKRVFVFHIRFRLIYFEFTFK